MPLTPAPYASTGRDPRPAVVIVTHETREEVLGCLGSLAADEVGEVVVVDSGSTDGTSEAVAGAFPEARLVSLHNVGFGRAANTGIRLTRADHVVVCNADVRYTPGACSRLSATLRAEDDLAAVGPRVRYPDGTVQASARSRPDLRTALVHGLLGRIRPDNAATHRYHARDTRDDGPRDADWLSGCALALRRRAVEEVGGFDPGFFLYVEDLDLGERLRAAGWRLRLDPEAEVVHRVGASTSQRRLRSLVAHARSLARYQTVRSTTPGKRLLPVALRPALAGWVIATWLAERLAGARRSPTGERLVGRGASPPAPPPGATWTAARAVFEEQT